ncbi:MAG: hypothetical protein HZC47_04190 [Methanobacterium sp.]|uniref:hypothetical protein n=1 Tax=Methanobacterium sp. TaxID=2164 RepID=UPI003D6465CC|nr:hypothetical protein [Methanobacterium sp.]
MELNKNSEIESNLKVPIFQRNKKRFFMDYLNWKKDIYNSESMEEYGLEISENQKRPIPGTYAIVTNEWIDLIVDIEKVLGLPQFTAKYLNVGIYEHEIAPKIEKMYNEEGIGQIELLFYPIPINCEVYFNDKLDPVQLIYILNLLDPKISEKEKEKYARGICNWMNPLILFRASQGKLTERLDLLPSNAKDYFSAILLAGANKAKKEKIPNDWDAMLEFIRVVGVLHEHGHALLTHIPNTSPPTQDNNDNTKQFDYQTYLKIVNNLLNTNSDFRTSKFIFKNLATAISGAREDEKLIYGDIVAGLMMETACDRFGMYRWETYFKIQACKPYFSEYFDDKPISTDFLFKLENARIKTEENPDLFINLCKKFGNENITNEDIQKLTEELENAERSHAYINVFRDPELFIEEREYFRKLLIFLQELDREGKIGKFNHKHYKESQIIINTRSNIKTSNAPQ